MRCPRFVLLLHYIAEANAIILCYRVDGVLLQVSKTSASNLAFAHQDRRVQKRTNRKEVKELLHGDKFDELRHPESNWELPLHPQRGEAKCAAVALDR